MCGCGLKKMPLGFPSHSFMASSLWRKTSPNSAERSCIRNLSSQQTQILGAWVLSHSSLLHYCTNPAGVDKGRQKDLNQHSPCSSCHLPLTSNLHSTCTSIWIQTETCNPYCNLPSFCKPHTTWNLQSALKSTFNLQPVCTLHAATCMQPSIWTVIHIQPAICLHHATCNLQSSTILLSDLNLQSEFNLLQPVTNLQSALQPAFQPASGWQLAIHNHL